MNQVRDQEKYAPEFNKFSMFFIPDVKNNYTAEVTADKVVFADGTIYQYVIEERAVYRNDTIITENVDSFTFSSIIEPVSNVDKQIINVKMAIDGKVNLKSGIDYTLRYW